MDLFKLNPKLNLCYKFGALEWLCRGLAALIFGCLTAVWLVPLAYELRGYRAVGGEWMVIFVVMFIVSEGIGLLLIGRNR